MIALVPPRPITWTGATFEVRGVLVQCGWCLGAKVLLEWPELGPRWELIPVVCRNCEGEGSVPSVGGVA